MRHFGFLHWDDQSYVTQNPHVLGGLSWRLVAWALTTGYPPYWQPLTWISHAADVSLFGAAAGGPHLVNVAIHAANAVLLFALLCRLTGARWRSALVAAVFAVHPLHVESVAWVAERKDVLSTFFWILTVFAYAAYARRPGGARRAGVAALFTLALLAKPMVVTLPLVLLLLDIWPLGRVRAGRDARWRGLIVEKLPLFGLAAAVSVITLTVQQRLGALDSVGALPWGVRLANALIACVEYLGKALWPMRLAAFYPHSWSLPWWRTLLAAALLAAISAAVVRLRRSRPYLLVGWCWYLCALTPTLGLIQSGEQAMADRFTYLPLVGLTLMTTWGLWDLAGRRHASRLAVTISAPAIIALLAFATWRQVGYWADDVTLWTHTVAVTDANYLGYDLLGLAYKDRGDWNQALANYGMARRFAPPSKPEFGAMVAYNTAYALVRAGRVDQALSWFDQAVQLKADFVDAEADYGAALVMLHRPDQAIPHFVEAIRIKPDSAEAHNGLGAALAQRGDPAGATAEYQQALTINPDLAVAHANLAIIDVGQNRVTAAIDEYTQALAREPNHPGWQFNVGVLLAKAGRFDEAADHLNAALKLDPTFDQARRALGSLPAHHD